MLSLLKSVGLETRLVNEKKHVVECMNESIDWDAVGSKIAQSRQFSLGFLRNSLSGL